MTTIRRLVCIIALVLTTSCSERHTHVFTYSNEQPAGALRSQSMLFFKEELEKRTNGRIQVELYFSGVLGTERELMDLVAMGALQGTRGGFFADAKADFNWYREKFILGVGAGVFYSHQYR